MTNWLEITGISLQIFAGLIFILDNIAHKFSTSIERWTSKAIAFLTGQGRRRWRIIILLSLVALPVIVISLAQWGLNEKITWAAVGGVLIFTVIGFDVYGILLILIGRRTMRGDIAQHMRTLIEDGKIVRINVIIFVITFLWLVIHIFFLFNLYLDTSNSAQEILLLLSFIFTFLVVVPVFFFSSTFVILESLVRFTSLMGKIESKYYWIAIVVVWIAGGSFLLANALC